MQAPTFTTGDRFQHDFDESYTMTVTAVVPSLGGLDEVYEDTDLEALGIDELQVIHVEYDDGNTVAWPNVELVEDQRDGRLVAN